MFMLVESYMFAVFIDVDEAQNFGFSAQ